MKPWTTDGCTDFGFNSRIIAYADPKLAADILVACYHHDFGYWKGGTLADRVRVDDEFYNVIHRALVEWEVRERGEADPYDAERVLELVDDVYRLSVRVGGSPFWPTSWRWGYSHPWLRWWAPVDKALEDEALLRLLELSHKARQAAEA